MNQTLKDRLPKIKLILTDVDGVLTDGKLCWAVLPDGNPVEMKHFESLDGMGLLFLKYCGFKTGIISKGKGPVLEFWAKALGMDYLYGGLSAKQKALDDVLSRENLTQDEVAFIGDDIIDLAVLKRVGLPFAVQNAVEEVKQAALYTARRPGGAGAVREIAELILKERGLWDKVLTDVEEGVFVNPESKLSIVKGL